MRTLLTLTFLSVALCGCATNSTDPKLNLYTGVRLIVKSDVVLKVPTDLPKEFIEISRNRLLAFSKNEVEKRGDLTLTENCSEKTMRVIQEITAITLGGETSDYKANWIVPGGTKKTEQNTNLSTSLRVEDCTTGKLLYSSDFEEKGSSFAKLLQEIAKDSIKYAYRNQYAK